MNESRERERMGTNLQKKRKPEKRNKRKQKEGKGWIGGRAQCFYFLMSVQVFEKRDTVDTTLSKNGQLFRTLKGTPFHRGLLTQL
jgi:hypothetical protein